jgi:hypothetical protein
MTTFYKARRGRRPSSTDWLQVLDVDGPFLAAPVVHDTWPDGLPALAQSQMDALRNASTLYDANPGTRDAFISHVLTHSLDWRHNLATGPDAAAFNVAVPEHHQTVEISFALRAQDQDGTVQDAALLLGMVLPPKTATTGRAPAGSGTWTAGPADRLAHALRMRKVPLGIVTNGDTWTLVTVSDGGAVSTASWTRHAWLEEPQTLRAFVALLTRTRFYGVPDDATLPGLLTKSLARQEEVTERLAEQSQAVVEMLVATLGRLDAQHQAEHGTRLLPPDVGPADVYQAAVTVLMRLVFLLYAEERGLLPLDDDTYASAYAVNTLADSLRDRATDHGEDALERTATGWYRLLALFRGVHRGARHEQLILPAYGGSLFDPDRFPWLEGRATSDAPLGSSDVPAIDDRTLLKALDSLQTLQFAKERRQVSYRSLDVEQIGYVYEGLLDQDALTATDWVVSIAVSDQDPRKNGPELLLADLEQRKVLSDDALATWLSEQIKHMKGNRSKASILKALTPPEGDDKPRYERLVREACGNDDANTSRVLPFAKLLRLDPRDLPVLYPPGSLYLTDSTARANTGAIYTPRFLAERVVETTLEAIVYAPGPLDTEDKSKWVLKTPEQILGLKVCDIAAGSGAFLVAATRYLAERLLESRRLSATDALAHAGDIEETAPEVTGATAVLRELAQAEQDELDARRAVIVNCIYGVDINPMAIEMAKLSLWLTSLDRNRPFSFLDDHLAVGDSLLGITSPQQLIDLHFDPKKGRALHEDTLDLFTSSVEIDLKSASELRAQIPLVGDRDSRDAKTKERLLRRAGEITARLSLVADGLTAASLAGGRSAEFLIVASLVSEAGTGNDRDDTNLRIWIDACLNCEGGGVQHKPAHYPLMFPEVFTAPRRGFDAVFGNPPFLGGGKISGSLGEGYREHLAMVIASGRRAKRPDLAAFFLLRARALVDGGVLGLITTNSISQGDTREIALDALLAAGDKLFAAVKSRPWPTRSAALEFSCIWLATDGREVTSSPILDDVPGGVISSQLEREGFRWTARRLEEAASLAFMGSVLHGAGFLLQRAEAEALFAEEPELTAVIRPFLGAEDLTQRPDQRASRFAVDFGRRTRQECLAFPLAWRIIEERVKPERRLLDPKRYARIVENYWEYWAPREKLYAAIKDLDRVIAIPLVSKFVAASFVDTHQVFQHGVGVVVTDQPSMLALLSSAPHSAWTHARCSTLETRIRYGLTDVLETLPKPEKMDSLQLIGEAFSTKRQQDLSRHDIGLTRFYNAVHDEGDRRAFVEEFRALQVGIDLAVCSSYGWDDLALSHGFRETPQGPRFTVRDDQELALAERLLRLNQERHFEEQSMTASSKQPPTAGGQPPQTLFGEDA